MCIGLESEGYQFDDFSVTESAIQITYPDGSQQYYPQAYSVTPIVITDIERDYDSLEFLDNEIPRLEIEARTFCEDYQRVATNASSGLSLSGVFYWDYIDGVRGGFWFNEHCNVVGSYGWSTGSYGSSYQPNLNKVCPSGHVIH